MARHASRFACLLFTRLLVVTLACVSSAALAQATVTLTMDDDQASEAGPTTASFTVTRSGPTGSALDVWLSGSGAATWGSDWTGSGGDFFVASLSSFRVRIPTGESSVTVTILPKQDNSLEGQESFSFSIATNAAYIVGNPSSDSFFLDDDVAEVSIEMTDSTATEAGPTTATLVVRRTSNGLLSDSLTVRLSGTGTATWGVDWTADGGSFFVQSLSLFRVTIPADELSATVTITPLQENRLEGQEDFTFTVEPSVNTNDGYLVGADASDSFTLDDNVAEVTIEMTDDVATEFGPTTATLVVRRTSNGLLSDSLTVRLSGTGTATWGVDWTADGGSFFVQSLSLFRVTIPADELSATVTITPKQDPIVDGESDEDFTFTLSPSVGVTDGYTVGDPDSSTFTLINYGPQVFKDGLESP